MENQPWIAPPQYDPPRTNGFRWENPVASRATKMFDAVIREIDGLAHEVMELRKQLAVEKKELSDLRVHLTSLGAGEKPRAAETGQQANTNANPLQSDRRARSSGTTG